MTEIHVTLRTTESMGDHDREVGIAFSVQPGETVEHLFQRVMEMGDFQTAWRNHRPPSSWIELRYVDGTQPPPGKQATEVPF